MVIDTLGLPCLAAVMKTEGRVHWVDQNVVMMLTGDTVGSLSRGLHHRLLGCLDGLVTVQTMAEMPGASG
jgi:hypothetical protein